MWEVVSSSRSSSSMFQSVGNYYTSQQNWGKCQSLHVKIVSLVNTELGSMKRDMDYHTSLHLKRFIGQTQEKGWGFIR